MSDEIVTEEVVVPTDDTVVVLKPKKAKPITSYSKAINEEFKLDEEFTAIAQALSLEVDAVEYSLVDDENGHTLSGVAKS